MLVRCEDWSGSRMMLIERKESTSTEDTSYTFARRTCSKDRRQRPPLVRPSPSRGWRMGVGASQARDDAMQTRKPA